MDLRGKQFGEVAIPMQVNKATVVVNFNKKAPYDSRSNLIVSILKGVLNLRYTEEIREKEGGVPMALV